MCEQRYVALVGISFVEAGDDLQELTSLVRELAAGCNEDVCFWEGQRIAAILFADSSLAFLDGDTGRREAAEAGAVAGRLAERRRASV